MYSILQMSPLLCEPLLCEYLSPDTTSSVTCPLGRCLALQPFETQHTDNTSSSYYFVVRIIHVQIVP